MEVILMRVRILLPALVLVVLVTTGVGVAARSSSPAPIQVSVTEHGYVMPAVINGGVVTMRFRNAGKELHEFAMGRIDKGHTFAQALRAFEQNKEVSWLHDVAGPGVMTPGAEITITRQLAPGTYFFVDAVPNTRGVSFEKLGGRKAFRLTGDSGAQLPKADAVITAEKKRFVIPRLSAGVQTIELRNRAGSGRGFNLATLNPGKTQADVERWVKPLDSGGAQPRTPAPMTLLGAMQTIPSGTSVYLTVKLEVGRTYHLSDDESGVQAEFTPR
jgi:hypothetical protein